MSGGFADLGLLPELLQAIDDQRWVLPSDIQDEAIPLILGGGDVMGAAETGSGKTAAFALPILQSVYERLKSFEDTSSKAKASGDVVIQLNDNDRDSELSLTPPFSCSYLIPDRWLGIRATHGVKYGKAYYECSVRGTGNCRVGWSTRLASLDLGKDKMGYGYGAKGFKSTEGAFDKYGEAYSNGDIIGCLLDLDSKNVLFSRNGKVFDVAYPIHTDVQGAVFFPTITLSGSSVDVNFGQQPVRYCPPGFTALSNVPSDNLFSSVSADAYSIAGKRKPLAIVIEPTRDLAEQVYQTFLDLSKYIDAPKLRTALLIGDDGRVNVKKMLKEGVDIVVGTIGKLTAALQSKQLDLSQIRFFVLDEADRLTSADNLSSVKQIFTHCPQSGTGVHRLQVCFFSATLHDPAIRELADTICFNPIWVDLKGQDAVIPDTLHHVVYKLSTSDVSYNGWIKGQKPVTDQVHIEGDFARECADYTQNVHSQRVKEIKPYVVKSVIDKFKVRTGNIFESIIALVLYWGYVNPNWLLFFNMTSRCCKP
ncbi:DEAD/DEAH box helicase [archaeon]|nr:MAG: DEAD/DEAH box helicase [archaeon]